MNNILYINYQYNIDIEKVNEDRRSESQDNLFDIRQKIKFLNDTREILIKNLGESHVLTQRISTYILQYEEIHDKLNSIAELQYEYLNEFIFSKNNNKLNVGQLNSAIDIYQSELDEQKNSLRPITESKVLFEGDDFSAERLTDLEFSLMEEANEIVINMDQLIKKENSALQSSHNKYSSIIIGTLESRKDDIESTIAENQADLEGNIELTAEQNIEDSAQSLLFESVRQLSMRKKSLCELIDSNHSALNLGLNSFKDEFTNTFGHDNYILDLLATNESFHAENRVDESIAIKFIEGIFSEINVHGNDFELDDGSYRLHRYDTTTFVQKKETAFSTNPWREIISNLDTRIETYKNQGVPEKAQQLEKLRDFLLEHSEAQDNINDAGRKLINAAEEKYSVLHEARLGQNRPTDNIGEIGYSIDNDSNLELFDELISGIDNRLKNARKEIDNVKNLNISNKNQRITKMIAELAKNTEIANQLKARRSALISQVQSMGTIEEYKHKSSGELDLAITSLENFAGGYQGIETRRVHVDNKGYNKPIRFIINYNNHMNRLNANSDSMLPKAESLIKASEDNFKNAYTKPLKAIREVAAYDEQYHQTNTYQLLISSSSAMRTSEEFNSLQNGLPCTIHAPTGASHAALLARKPV